MRVGWCVWRRLQTKKDYELHVEGLEGPLAVRVKQLKLHPVNEVPHHITFVRAAP